MKKILIILGIFISTLSFSQVENGTLTIRYETMYEFNQYSDAYEFVSENKEYIKFYFGDDYYIIDDVKVSWDFDSNDETSSTYILEDNRVFIFDFDTQELYFFWDWNESLGQHENYVVWSKTSFEADN
jgi:hypothetical protein